MTDLLQVPAHFKKVQSKDTGAWQMVFETIDYVEPEIINRILTLNNNNGNLLFATRKLDLKDLEQMSEIPEAKKTDGKTPCQRLRAVLYVLHESIGGKKEDFDSYYMGQMEKFIDHVKGKLDH